MSIFISTNVSRLSKLTENNIFKLFLCLALSILDNIIDVCSDSTLLWHTKPFCQICCDTFPIRNWRKQLREGSLEPNCWLWIDLNVTFLEIHFSFSRDSVKNLSIYEWLCLKQYLMWAFMLHSVVTFSILNHLAFLPWEHNQIRGQGSGTESIFQSPDLDSSVIITNSGACQQLRSKAGKRPTDAKERFKRFQ